MFKLKFVLNFFVILVVYKMYFVWLKIKSTKNIKVPESLSKKKKHALKTEYLTA